MEAIDWKLIMQLVVYVVTLVSIFWKLKNQVDNMKDYQTGVSAILKDIRSEAKEEIKNAKQDFNERLCNLKSELEKYKDKNDTKINNVFSKLDEHYQKLDNKIDDLRTLIINKK
jgi:predicted nuclease with TOPRIM domain